MGHDPLFGKLVGRSILGCGILILALPARTRTQIDGCVTPDDSILSPAKSPLKNKLEFPYSFGMDIFMYDEPEYLEAYSVSSCPDLVFPYEYIETTPRGRARSESQSDPDLPSNHARRLGSMTDPLFLDL